MIGIFGRLFGPRLRGYKTIDAAMAARIVKAHKANPAMGRQRLQSLLTTQGAKVNGVELKRFLRDNKLDVAPPVRPTKMPAIARRKPSEP